MNEFEFICSICGELSDDGNIPDKICMGCDDILHEEYWDAKSKKDEETIVINIEDLLPPDVLKGLREELEKAKKEKMKKILEELQKQEKAAE